MKYVIAATLGLMLALAAPAALAKAQSGSEPAASGAELHPLDMDQFEELQRVTTTFDLRAGETLRQTLVRWAADAGWQVIWQSPKDYRIEASMVFPRGTGFKEAARSTARSIWRVNPTLKLRAYRNNVLVVEEVQA